MYQNDDLCQKYENNIPLAELNGEEFILLLDSQEVKAVLENVGTSINPNIISGAVVSVGDGDYKEVYLSESSRPFDLGSIYHPLSYYL